MGGASTKLTRGKTRRLVFILGDQLNRDSAVFDGHDPATDLVFMAEVSAESTKVKSHKARTTLFLSAMRHFRDQLRSDGLRLDYLELDADGNPGTLDGALTLAIGRHKPAEIVVCEPGEHGIAVAIESAARREGVALRFAPDRHFLVSSEEFAAFARGRKSLRLEHFYRPLRAKFGILMDGKEPVGGQWNFDHDNRGAFGKEGPGLLPAPTAFSPDKLTKAVIALVQKQFPEHPGDLSQFDWPVTRDQALMALDDFIAHRLPHFGRYQDAMWTGQPWLYHSRLSAALNLKLLDPREVVARAEEAYRSGQACLASVEGFIRQIVGWREYVRGIYWLRMPGYLELNHLGATLPLPDFYWTGDTTMSCMSDALGQTLKLGYAHHIQRLMVTGLFAMLFGVNPKRVHEWYLAVYVDAIEWVELPNTLGMSQYGDGGIMASKPYAASGKYIERMGNYCRGCRYDPGISSGPKACPFTTLYWDFVDRHRDMLAANPRMLMQVKNLEGKGKDELVRIREGARRIRLEMVGEDLIGKRRA